MADSSDSSFRSRFVQWQQRYISESVFAFFIAGIVGVLCGVAAELLKYGVKWLTDLLLSFCHPDGFNWILLVFPVCGILITGAICRYLLKYTPSHGTEKIITALTNKDYVMRPSLMFSSILTGIFTLGCGGSAGGEGPIAYTGAAIGSNMARKMGFSADYMRIMVGCGAGAGIAAIFKSPIGGALYSLEVLHMELTNVAVMGLLVAVVVAALTAMALSGFTFDIYMNQSIAFDPHWIPWIIALGIFCGLYSMYYNYFRLWLARQLEKLKVPVVKNLIGGGIIALTVFLCPALYGEGYGVIGNVINGDFSSVLNHSFLDGHNGLDVIIIMAAMVIALKAFACSATNYSGGVAGQFAPTLFAGCMVGLFFATTINVLFHAHVPVAHFAFFGMAGVMAGVIRAPLMAIFLVCEMSGSFGYFMPVASCVGLSFGIVRLFTLDRFFLTHRQHFNGFLAFGHHTSNTTDKQS